MSELGHVRDFAIWKCSLEEEVTSALLTQALEFTALACSFLSSCQTFSAKSLTFWQHLAACIGGDSQPLHQSAQGNQLKFQQEGATLQILTQGTTCNHLSTRTNTEDGNIQLSWSLITCGKCGFCKKHKLVVVLSFGDKMDYRRCHFWMVFHVKKPFLVVKQKQIKKF